METDQRLLEVNERLRYLEDRQRESNQRLLAKFNEFTTYDLTQKQNHDFQQWKERQKKCEEEKRRKQLFMLMSMRALTTSDFFGNEQKYFNRWIQEQKEKDEVFKIKTYGKK
jgi:hypothetical protein